MLLGSCDDFRTREGKQIISSEKSPHWAKAYKVIRDVKKEDRSARKQGIERKLIILKNQLELKEGLSRKETVVIVIDSSIHVISNGSL